MNSGDGQTLAPLKGALPKLDTVPSPEAALPGRRNASPIGAQAVDRALAVLGCFTLGEPELSLSAIARQLKLSVSTVHRLLGALVAAGYIEQDPSNGRYGLGRSAILIGQIALHNSGLGLARRVLEELARTTGESVNLGVRAAHQAVVILRVESTQPLRFDQPPGSRVLLHASSMGKALLAHTSDPAGEIAGLPSLTALTRHTITDPATLLSDLQQARARGYSMDDEEGMEGVRCVGAPVLDPSGHARAAVAIQVPAVRMPHRRMDELGRLVAAAAEEVAAVLPAHGGF